MKKYKVALIVTLLILLMFITSEAYANSVVHEFLKAYDLPPDTTREDFYDYIISNATIRPWEDNLPPNATREEIYYYLNWNNPKPSDLGIAVDKEYEDWHISFYASWVTVEPSPFFTEPVNLTELEPFEPLPRLPNLIKKLYEQEGLSGMFPNTTAAYESGMITQLFLGTCLELSVSPYISKPFKLITPMLFDWLASKILELSNSIKPTTTPFPTPTPAAAQAPKLDEGPKPGSNEDFEARMKAITEGTAPSFGESGGTGEWASPDGTGGGWDSGAGASGGWTQEPGGGGSLTWDDGHGGGGTLTW